MEFEWNDDKARENLYRHSVSFFEAMTVFDDDFATSWFDANHSRDEDRHIIVGMSDLGNRLAVCFTERGERVRIISARKLTARERRLYEDG